MKFAPLTALLFAFTLTGCATLQGLKSDISKGFSSFGNSVAEITDPKEEKKKLPVYDGTCPSVNVRPDLTRLTEFYNSDQSDANKTSEVVITNVRNTCRVENGGIVMQIDLSLSGRTGPKARKKPSDKPNFAYPYFIAVTDQTGNVVSKEIFAVTVSYDANQNEKSMIESVFQNMPVPDSASGQSFSVVLGFQLTDAQLSYNNSRPAQITP